MNIQKPHSIGLYLLFAVNLLLSILLGGLLFWQYSEKMEQALHEKRSSLTDEAIAVHAAVTHLSGDHGDLAVQGYIDSVCRQMRAAWSPHHHIVVKLSGRLFSDSLTANCLPAVTEFETGADEQFANRHVSGSHSHSEISVTVSETSGNIRRAARRDVLTQIGIFAALGILTAIIVNLVLLRIVEAPLKQLLAVVDDIAAGKLGTQAPNLRTCEMQRLAVGINWMSQSLADADSARRLQMHKAQQIQQNLLPYRDDVPYLHIAHVFEPVEEVGGDYYDFLPSVDGSWIVCLADVMGHGVPAAMGAAMLKALLLAESERPAFCPVSAIANINRRYTSAILEGHFASMFLGKWNPTTLEFRYVSAGHEPAILQRASGEIETLQSTGTLVGLDPGARWDVRSATLSPNDRVLIFSDGVTETEGPGGTLFGRNRLIDALNENRRFEVSSTVINLCRTIGEYRGDRLPHDDLTLLLLGCCAESQSRPVLEAPELRAELQSHVQA